MKIRDLQIRPISYRMAMNMVVQYHYLHRKAPCSYAFGLFDGENLLGCICYGTPSSATLRSGICGKDEANNVIELTRLFIKDEVGKNAESYLIGNTIRKINKEIVVSYAEKDYGHIGTIYQATNFHYTGLSAKRTSWKVEGLDIHCQTLADKYTVDELREKFGDKFSSIDRPRKHRYVFFNCNKRRRKILLQKLKYDIEPYPKSYHLSKMVV